ncbi:DUF5134 domain-containing protein [Plantibacter sp. PA-3-X8]|nr:DUF5134 domain-containing protein [Plantibacter sp. PA-3-X8]NUJ89105.1 DUF5134 domain-containing protein [Plantibacter sp. MCCC 1A11337]
MPYPTPVAIIMTVLFFVTGVGYLIRAARDRDPVGRLSDIFHVVMSFSMLAMPWSWGMAVFPPVIQIIVFSLATLFYLVLLFGTPAPAHHTDPDSPISSHHHAGWPRVGFHAFMMGAMVVMGVLMNGMSHDEGHMDPPQGLMWTAENVISVSFMVAFGVSTIWYLASFIRLRRAPSVVRLNLSLMALMAIGMCLGFWPVW